MNFTPLVFLLLIICYSSFGQITPSTPDIASLSPNSASLGKFGEIPVSYYTGTPDITIPLYSVKEGSLKLDVSLKYHASGILIDEKPGWVGLGWTLDAGGVIVRKVRGQYDEKAFWGFINTDGQINDDVWSQATNSFNNTSALLSETSKYFQGLYDPMPDEFIFNFNGSVGKFYFTRSGLPLTTSPESLKIEYFQRDRAGAPAGVVTHEIYKWKITTPEGTQYFFEATEKSRALMGEEINTAWYLTSIISPDNTSKIDLTYNSAFRSYYGSQCSEYYISSVASSGMINSYSTFMGGEVPLDITSAFLSHIKTSNADIIFDTVRVDLNGDYELGDIKINRISGQEVKRFTFSYKQYGSEWSTKAFLLDKLQETSSSEQNPPYSFVYDETVRPQITDVSKNPSFASYGAVDYWGYYSGPNISGYNSRIQVSPLFADPNWIVGLPDRNSNYNYAKAGILTQINYPTKGYSKFDYESNDYSYVNNQIVKPSIVQGGGLRIRQITDYDGINHNNDVTRTFTYRSQDTQLNSSGVIANEPITSYTYSSEKLPPLHDSFSSTISSNSVLLPIDIGYSQVTEAFSNGEFVVYRYITERDYPNTPFSDDITIVAEVESVGNDWAFKRLNHPFRVSRGRYFYMKGLQKEKLIYNSSGVLDKHIFFNYQPRETFTIRSFSLSYYGHIDLGIGTMSMPRWRLFMQSFRLAIGHPELVEEKTVTSVNDYPQLVEDKKYEYNLLNWRPSRVRMALSDGREAVSIYKYPLDYGAILGTAVGPALAIKNLQDKRIIDKPIEVYSYTQNADQTNQNLVTGSLKTFNVARSLINEMFEIGIQSPIPLPSFTPSYIQSGTTFIKDSHYISKTTFDAYDDLGNLSQYSLTNNFKTSYIWGYNKQFPIAEVKNSAIENVRVTSFEEPLNSNFSCDGLLSASLKKRGNQSLYLNNQYAGLVINGLTPSTSLHKLSFWILGASQNFSVTNGSTTTNYTTSSSAGWNYFETLIAPSTSMITIKSQSIPTKSIYLDELRFAPSGSKIRTFLYDPAFGMTCETDDQERSIYYEFDTLGRLKLKKDNDGNILNSLEYHYKN